ncbi:myelin protein zero-like protein 1 [Colossoma macropomum]|uniref:myelin protein zero-like protein 1 n=1 Tax=Colossoma macropomum TaxID=42526 RepID=UPI0018656470|nr:myelin protein zero-like protein 1 [Colossoma macropomum]
MESRLSNPTFNSVLFCIVAVWTTTGIYPAAAIELDTPAEIFVENGTTGTLKCWFKSTEVISSQASVSWSFIPEGSPESTGVAIFYYSGGKSFPDSPQFKARVEWAGDLNKKDASIRVTQMQFLDNGTYSCDVKNPPDLTGKPSLTKLRVVMKEFLEETSPRKTEEYCLRTVA